MEAYTLMEMQKISLHGSLPTDGNIFELATAVLLKVLHAVHDIG
jgi:hypothetical protein